MAVFVIDTLKPKNNGKFPIAEATDVTISTGVGTTSTLQELYDSGKLAGVRGFSIRKTTETLSDAGTGVIASLNTGEGLQVGDLIIDAAFNVYPVTAVTSPNYTVGTSLGSIKGAQGEKGADGTAAGFGTPTATVSTLDAGAEATATVDASGPDTAKVFTFKFGIPKGADGAQGPQGDPGAAGAAAGIDEAVTVNAENAGNVGTPTVTAAFSGEDTNKHLTLTFENLKGATGEKGDPGAAGAAAGFAETAATATVNTLEAGAPATVSVQATGGNTDKAFAFTFGIPKGEKGDKGDPGSTSTDDIMYGDKTLTEILGQLLYVAPQITSFTNNVNTVEVGQTITTVTFNWKLNKEMTSVTLNDDPQTTTTTGTATLSDQNITSNTTYTLKAGDGTNTVAKTTSINFQNKVYWGIGTVADAGSVDSSFVLGLSGSSFATSIPRTFTVNAGEGQYIYYAFPDSFGSATFKVGGFEGGFDLLTTFELTNASGGKAQYKVYKSTNPNLGNTTVEASKAA